MSNTNTSQARSGSTSATGSRKRLKQRGEGAIHSFLQLRFTVSGKVRKMDPPMITDSIICPPQIHGEEVKAVICVAAPHEDIGRCIAITGLGYKGSYPRVEFLDGLQNPAEVISGWKNRSSLLNISVEELRRLPPGKLLQFLNDPRSYW